MGCNNNGVLLHSFPEARGPVGEVVHSLTLEAQGVPSEDQLAPRPTKPGTLDLTASTLFVGAFERHAAISNYARSLNKLFPFGNGNINLGAILHLFFRTLHGLHNLWRQKTNLTVQDRSKHGLNVKKF